MINRDLVSKLEAQIYFEQLVKLETLTGNTFEGFIEKVLKNNKIVLRNINDEIELVPLENIKRIIIK